MSDSEDLSDPFNGAQSSREAHAGAQYAVGSTFPSPRGVLKRMRVASTLDNFIVRTRPASDEPTSVSPDQEQPLLPCNTDSLCPLRIARRQDIWGRCTARGKAALQHLANATYKEVIRWPGWRPGMPEHVTGLQPNSSGSMLAVAMHWPDNPHGGAGMLAVYELCSLREGFGRTADKDRWNKPRFYVPLSRGNCRRTRLAWNPLEQERLYAISSAGFCIEGFNLESDKAGPATTYGGSDQLRGCGASVMPRYFALDFFKCQGPHVMATAGSNGAVALWDARTHKRPCSMLQGPQNTRALLSVQVAPDGRAVIAGSECGQVLMWDVRGGRAPTAQLGAYGPAQHPVLAAVKLRGVLAAVPGLTQQTHLPGTSLMSLILDPCDPRRAAFGLPCGWQGVLDLVRQKVTHLYCPPQNEDDSRGPYLPTLPVWGKNTGPYCAASLASGVTLLDFNSVRASPCAVSGSPDPEDSAQLPSCVQVPTSETPMSLAIHPDTQEIIVGTAGSNKLLLLDRMAPEAVSGDSWLDEAGSS